jgi:hypothetical protein
MKQQINMIKTTKRNTATPKNSSLGSAGRQLEEHEQHVA